jgi:hypothetical protein
MGSVLAPVWTQPQQTAVSSCGRAIAILRRRGGGFFTFSFKKKEGSSKTDTAFVSIAYPCSSYERPDPLNPLLL